MPYHLLTVESVAQSDHGVRVGPRVPISRLIEDLPDTSVPMPGDPLELRLPDGRGVAASVGVFGVDVERRDGYYYVDNDPARPELTMTVGDVRPSDLPVGTQIWLPT